MQKLKPINIESDVISVHPLRNIDILRKESIENDIYQILSDNETTEFIPEKRLKDLKGASEKVFGIILGYQTNLSYGLLVSDKRNNKVIGIINIISPDCAKQTYKIDKYDWMIEYFLHKNYWGQGIMTGIITAICKKLKGQGIETIGAICDRNNNKSIRVLEKIGFQKNKLFDIKQDYYEI